MLTEKEIEALVERGRQALVRGLPHGALEPLCEALSFDSEHARAHALLAEALRQLGRLDAALGEANAAIGAEPEMSYAHCVLADVHYDRREVVLAKRHYDTAREFGPMDPRPLRGLARVARFEDHDAEALSLLEKARELEPGDVATHVALGQLHRARGRREEARDCAKRALELEPEQLQALVLMGHVLLDSGDVRGAREHAVWALRADATDLDAITLIAAVKARESFLWGLWYRANARSLTLGSKSVLVLLAMYVGQYALRLVLEDLGFGGVALVLRVLWLATCFYSWVGPARFRALVRRELETVKLRPDY